MKNFLKGSVVVFVGLLILVLLSSSGDIEQAADISESVRESGAPVPAGNDGGSSGNAIEIQGDTYLVTRVIDGDTIELENGERVRYLGVDTPESVHPSEPIQCFGVESATKNRELVEGKRVTLEKDITDRDKYGRLLRYVFVNGVHIGLELVRQGYASVYTYPPDVRYSDELLVAQQEARNAKRGLWGSCDGETMQQPSEQPTVAPPPVFSQVTDGSDGQCNIKGNINSKGEKIYHIPGCASYDVTKIDEARGERWFCSEGDAFNAGWRRALNC